MRNKEDAWPLDIFSLFVYPNTNYSYLQIPTFNVGKMLSYTQKYKLFIIHSKLINDYDYQKRSINTKSFVKSMKENCIHWNNDNYPSKFWIEIK